MPSRFMSTNNEILQTTQAYVASLLNGKLPPWAVYHTLQHTEETVAAAREIGEASKLSKSDLEIVLLAAWFHDLGYIDTADGHEERSVEMAEEFLKKHSYSPERIERVVACIRATKVPQKPATMLEQVVCDADMIHLGKKRFFERSELLRMEIELRTGKPFTDVEWLQKNVEFASSGGFFTAYARSEFAPRREKNLLLLHERFREARERDGQRTPKQHMAKEKAVLKEEKEKRPERGIETMFRVVPKNHLDLSALADQKANIMISTNAIIISIVFGLLLSKLDTHPFLTIPTVILLAVCLTAMIFAILATRPNITSGTFTREDIEQKRANLLFFGNFYNSRLEDFEWGMKEMMNDRTYLYGSMIKDLYYLGKVLGKKYRMLRFCYTIFMYGLIVSVFAFVIALLTAPAPVPLPPQ